MTIIINGETKEYIENSTLLMVIDGLGIKVKVMAAAVNMDIVKKDDWGTCQLVDGDKVELLDFVGGG